MKIIVVGVAIEDNGKLLMVQEKKEKVYGKWNFPAGHLDENEKIIDGARRETKEETGYDVEIIGVLPIVNPVNSEIIRITYLGKIVGGELSFDKEELLDVKWFSFEELLSMNKEELRSYEVNINILNSIIKKEIYSIEIIRDLISID
jgi:ADP-ribose pyrophosphatase YjhB (NUDIX family)